jgi:hypothetical protein
MSLQTASSVVGLPAISGQTRTAGGPTKGQE